MNTMTPDSGPERNETASAPGEAAARTEIQTPTGWPMSLQVLALSTIALGALVVTVGAAGGIWRVLLLLPVIDYAAFLVRGESFVSRFLARAPWNTAPAASPSDHDRSSAADLAAGMLAALRTRVSSAAPVEKAQMLRGTVAAIGVLLWLAGVVAGLTLIAVAIADWVAHRSIGRSLAGGAFRVRGTSPADAGGGDPEPGMREQPPTADGNAADAPAGSAEPHQTAAAEESTKPAPTAPGDGTSPPERGGHLRSAA